MGESERMRLSQGSNVIDGKQKNKGKQYIVF